MPYSLKQDEKDQCVFLIYEGGMVPIEIVAGRYGASGLVSALGWNRMVIDISRLQTIPPQLELFRLFNSFSSDLPSGARIALVIRAEQAKPARLVQNIARSDGMSVLFFLDMKEAVRWVKQPNPREHTRNQLAGHYA